MIQNYGLYWERKYLHFGIGCNKGHLKGIRDNNSETVDFRDQIGIYVLYDETFSPVYVGQAGNGEANLFSRLKQHTKDHLWNRWQLFSWFGIRKANGNGTLCLKHGIDSNYRCDGPSLLNELEGIIIATVEPILNKQGAKLNGADRYKQVVDERVRELSLGEVMDKITYLERQNDELLKHVKKLYS